MEEDYSFVAPGHLPSRWHGPLTYPQTQQGFHPSQPHQRNAQTFQNTTWTHHSNGQGYPSTAQPYHYNTQAYHNKAQAYQPPETHYCGPCNRTFHSQFQLERHLAEHVKCPFPECRLTAHPKAIERHIDNQHLLVNFANLQIDDEAWIAERKRRFPTIERAELRRAQQLEKAKRGEKLGKSTKPFAARGGRGRGRGRGREQTVGGRVSHSGGVKNDKRPGDSELNDERGKKRRKMQSEGNSEVKAKNEGEEENNFAPPPSHRAPHSKVNARAATITLPDPDSDEEEARDGIPVFRGTRHFYESTGEMSYFGTKSGTALECQMKEEVMGSEPTDVNHISDEEEWNETRSEEANIGAHTVLPRTLVLGGALGSLMGAYSDSEDDNDKPESAPEAARLSSIQDKIQNNSKDNQSYGSQAAEHDKNKNENNGRNEFATKSTKIATTSTTPTAQAPATSKTYKQQRKKRRHPKNGMKKSLKRPGGARTCFPKRRKTLLERLLLPDITRERNIILQCIRFIVQHDLFLPKQTMEEVLKKGDKGIQKDEDGQKEGSQKIKVENKESEREEEGSGESHEMNVDMAGKSQGEEGKEDAEGKEKTEDEAEKQENENIRNNGETVVEEVMHDKSEQGPGEAGDEGSTYAEDRQEFCREPEENKGIEVESLKGKDGSLEMSNLM